MRNDIFVPPNGPPRVARPDPAIYAIMGQENIFKMLEDFYAALAKSAIRHMFPESQTALQEAAHKSAAFFVGLLGGPPLYQQWYGPPMLRARHLPFEIDEAARQEWLRCFDLVLEQAETKYSFPPQHLPSFRTFLYSFSGWMVNKASSGSTSQSPADTDLSLFGRS